MDQGPQSEAPEFHKIGFKSVQLLKDQTLGIGSYGVVCKAKCDDLLCAAKILHQTLYKPIAQPVSLKEHRMPMKRFEKECEFLSIIKHPNIVQYLGMDHDSDTHLPVILMELMDDNLTHFLETSPKPVSFHIQVNICDDICQALSFLHSNNIIHRDLSGNNVLLIGDVKAKVSDFGMAQFNPHRTHLSFTACPGTDVYMPPEAVKEDPVYTERIDCFSFGVIIIQILTRQFPKPANRQKEVQMDCPGLPRGTLMVCVPEIDRRQNHICSIDQNHHLLPVALNCLKDKESERPSAQDLCDTIAALKKTYGYCESVMSAQGQSILPEHSPGGDARDRELKSMVKDLQQHIASVSIEKDQNSALQAQIIAQQDQIIVSKEQEIQQLRQQIKERDTHLGRVNEQLEVSEQVIAQFEGRINELEQQLHQKEEPLKQLANIKLTWEKLEQKSRGTIAIFNGKVVFNLSHDLHEYNPNENSWSQLSNCPNKGCSLVVINNLLTTVGGYLDRNYSNTLFSLTGRIGHQNWTEIFPPMPTERAHSSALVTRSNLIVAGGERGKDMAWSVAVEVMNTATHQWSIAAYLPEPIYAASSAICGDCIYILGGMDRSHRSSNSVYTCSQRALIQSCHRSGSLKASLKRVSLVNVWNRLADIPVTGATCVSLRDQLIAVGGRESEHSIPTAAIHVFNPAINSWEVISHMSSGRNLCSAAVLPDGRLMVVGGIRSVEFGTLV